MHRYIVEYEAIFARDLSFSPTRLPTLVAAAKPIDNGSIKNKLAIFKAM